MRGEIEGGSFTTRRRTDGGTQGERKSATKSEGGEEEEERERGDRLSVGKELFLPSFSNPLCYRRLLSSLSLTFLQLHTHSLWKLSTSPCLCGWRKATALSECPPPPDCGGAPLCPKNWRTVKSALEIAHKIRFRCRRRRHSTLRPRPAGQPALAVPRCCASGQPALLPSFTSWEINPLAGAAANASNEPRKSREGHHPHPHPRHHGRGRRQTEGPPHADLIPVAALGALNLP